MGSYANWREVHNFKLYSQKPQQSIRQRNPFVIDKKADTYKN